MFIILYIIISFCIIFYTLLGEKMIFVKLKKGEPFEKAVRRFRRKVETEGIMRDLKKRQFHMTKSEKRKEKRKLAKKRRLKLLKKSNSLK